MFLNKYLTRNLNQRFGAVFLVLVLLSSLFTTLQPQSVAAASASYRIATYNILGSNHVNAGREIGGSVADRAKRAAAIVRGPGEKLPFDVVGMQEVMPDQYRMLTKLLPGYASFPATGKSQQRIFWRSSRFVLAESGWFYYPGYSSKNLESSDRSPWIKLQDRATKAYFYVINQHPVAWNEKPGSDKGGALKREQTAQLLKAWILEKKQTDLPVFAVGDFNSAPYLRIYKKNFDIRKKDDVITGQRGRLPYCILTHDNLTANGYDMARGRTGTCPTKYSPAVEDLLDHVYVTPQNVQVTKWKQIDTKKARRASDHLPVYIDAVIKSQPTTQTTTTIPADTAKILAIKP